MNLLLLGFLILKKTCYESFFVKTFVLLLSKLTGNICCHWALMELFCSKKLKITHVFYNSNNRIADQVRTASLNIRPEE